MDSCPRNSFYKNMAPNDPYIEHKIVFGGACVSMLIFIFLRTLTRATKRRQDKRLKKEKEQKQREILAQQEMAIQNSQQRLENNRQNLFQSSRQTQSETTYRYHPSPIWTPLSVPGYLPGGEQRPRSPRSPFLPSPISPDPFTPLPTPTVFNFDPQHISEFESFSFESNTSTSPRLSPSSGSPNSGESYREWSLRRRDIQLSQMYDV